MGVQRKIYIFQVGTIILFYFSSKFECELLAKQTVKNFDINLNYIIFRSYIKIATRL